ncbi:quinone oxidoreductase family protein [Nocardia cyriacigeorgica]|uniref:quinone oxidoreductase family protein n=1 Tax=Nocardia cyriacigeorgica TaxID=135487 RepID=UPI003CC7C6F4
MQAIVMTGTGGPEVLVAREVPEPRPEAGEVLIRTEAIPVLYPETLLRSGVFPMAAELPAVFGFQAAGEVVEVGAGVDRDLVGRRVVVETAGAGSYAEFVRASAESATPIPAGVSADDAAAAVMSGSVALALLKAAHLTGTETVLVEAGATGVGSYLVQLAEQFGAARVIATAGDAAKRERTRELGAADVVDHRDDDWTETLRGRLGDATVDVVFDSIGGSSAARLLDVMTPGSGRMLSYGWLSGAPAQVSAGDLPPPVGSPSSAALDPPGSRALRHTEPTSSTESTHSSPPSRRRCRSKTRPRRMSWSNHAPRSARSFCGPAGIGSGQAGR